MLLNDDLKKLCGVGLATFEDISAPLELFLAALGREMTSVQTSVLSFKWQRKRTQPITLLWTKMLSKALPMHH
jgi:hypothetical protein